MAVVSYKWCCWNVRWKGALSSDFSVDQWLVHHTGSGWRRWLAASEGSRYTLGSPLLKSCCWWLLLIRTTTWQYFQRHQNLSVFHLCLPSVFFSFLCRGFSCLYCAACTRLALMVSQFLHSSYFLNRQVSRQPSTMCSQLEPRYSSDGCLPVITRILPPRVMPRVSLAVTLTGMGNYNIGVVRSRVPRLQPRRRLYWSFLLAISAWLGSLCCLYVSPSDLPYACSAPAFILLSRDESSLFVSTQPAMPPSHFSGFGVLWLCTWTWPNRPTRQWLCHCS